ncbi:unnamed protein product, partial [Anisakis simplex]|uniref:TIL domain-containing protein n=1 Tax=Anisakis simplex TaxID=6269 RepID=A0A0M3J546_ANISI
QCGPNEVYKYCGSACPKVCGKNDFEPCPTICVQGCFCKQGYILNRKGGQCIRESHCRGHVYPKQKHLHRCGPNEIYSRCGTQCPAICGQREPEVCTLACVAGCFCKSGYILDRMNGKCIRHADCRAGQLKSTAN